MNCGIRKVKLKMNRVNLKDVKKRAVSLLFIMVLCLSCLTGCAGRTRLVFTTGLSGKQLFKIGTAECSLPEVMVYLTTFYNEYADTYGADMWSYDFGGVSLEQHVKDVVLSKMVQIKIMNLMAQEQKIALTAEEEEKVSAAAKAYYEELSDSLRSKENITRKVAEQVFREYAVANKVYGTITESEDMEISDDEARTVTVQEISLQTPDEASDILKRVRMGENFETAAVRTGEGRAVTRSYARGDTEAALEDVLFSMDEGEISEVVETSEGYVIIKCVSTMDDEATQANKIVLAEKRKSEAFSDAYREIAVNTYSQFRDKLWKKVSMNEKTHRTEADFFEIYDKYMKQ